MKTNILHILLLLSALIVLSCSRQYPESGQQSSEEGSSEFAAFPCTDGCDPSQFTYHPAVSATADKGGNIEYWECPHCMKAYSDAEGTEPVVGYVYTLPTKYLADLSPLASLTSAPKTKGAIETVELVLSIIGLGTSIAALAISIESLCSSGNELQEAYEDLEEQSERTQEELAQMEKYYREIEVCIDDLMQSSEVLNSSLQELGDKLETFNLTLEEIDRTLLELTSSISEISEDVRADRIIDERHSLRISLRQPVQDCYTSMTYYLQNDLDKLCWVDSFKDTLDIFRTIVSHQSKVVDEWALSDNDRAAEVMTLITTFNTVSYNYKENIPSFLEQYTENHIAWEHLGFLFRRSYLLQDLYLMSMGQSLCKEYFTLNKDIDKQYAARKYELMSERYSRARELISEDSLKMAAAYADHRLCHTNGKKYSIRPHLVPFKDFCDKYVQVQDANYYIYPHTYNYILYDVPQDSSITREDVELMERFYFGTDRTVSDLYFGTENGGLELISEESLSDPQLVVPYATEDPVICPEDKIYLVHIPSDGDYYCFLFDGYFHNPFLSSDFLCKTSSSYERDNYLKGSNAGLAVWGSWPDCFTPVYYSEAVTQ